jgi:hypothetical protein
MRQSKSEFQPASAAQISRQATPTDREKDNDKEGAPSIHRSALSSEAVLRSKLDPSHDEGGSQGNRRRREPGNLETGGGRSRSRFEANEGIEFLLQPPQLTIIATDTAISTQTS